MSIRDEILNRVRTKAGGNSDRGLKEVACDLVNNLGMKDSEIADLTFLSASTIARVRSNEPSESGAPYAPQAFTLERIFRGCGAEISLTPVKISKKFMNKPKDEVAE